jgi:hypothetical protein
MIKLSRLASPTALLYLYVTLTQFASGIYLASGLEKPPAFTVVYSVGFLWIVGWWLLTDSRRRGISWVYDIGMFLDQNPGRQRAAADSCIPGYLRRGIRSWRGILSTACADSRLMSNEVTCWEGIGSQMSQGRLSTNRQENISASGDRPAPQCHRGQSALSGSPA